MRVTDRIPRGWKKGYKVTKMCRNSRYGSPFALVRYYIGQNTQPDIGDGPLTVFSNSADACQFAAHTGGGSDVYVCYYQPSRLRHTWRRPYHFGVPSLPVRVPVSQCPPGTRLAEAVMLVDLWRG